MEGRDIVLQTDGRAVSGEGLKFFLNPLANLEGILPGGIQHHKQKLTAAVLGENIT